MKAFRADWICPVSSDPVRGSALLVSDGRIREVGEIPEGIPVEEFPGCAIVPGFVNVHTHLELTVFRGFLENLAFIDWIRTLTRTRSDQLSREDLGVSARLGAAECLAAGVTAVGEVMESGAGWDAMRESGLRGIAYQEVFGPSSDQAEAAVRGLEKTISGLPSGGVDGLRRLGVSPHAPYSVSADLYRKVRNLAGDRLPIALHIGESEAEGRFVRRGEGPFAEFLRARGIAVEGRGVGPLTWVDGLGMLGPRTLAIHAIDTAAAEVARLRDTDTAVAHCPKSNLKLGHGIAPLRELLDAGVRVGLGTDSVASNNVVDMFEEMRTALFLQRSRSGDPSAMTADEVFRMATLGGARCLGLESELGSLEPGKRADFAVVGLGEVATQPVYDPVETMVFSANRRNVSATYLAGERVDADPGALIASVREIADRLRGSGASVAGHESHDPII